MPLRIDIAGQKFGNLQAIGIVGKTSKRESIWLCRCSCGNVTQVKLSNLRDGRSKSCGCGRKREGK